MIKITNFSKNIFHLGFFMRVSDTKQNQQSFYKGHIYQKQSSIRTDTHIYVIHSDGSEPRPVHF